MALQIQKNILVVDDNDDIRFLLRKRLERMGLNVVEAAGGYAVLGYIRSGREPDVVILDMILPERSGLELLGCLRAKWRLAKIFIYSGHEEYRGREILQEYIDGFFLKAEGMDMLMNEIAQCVQPVEPG